MTQFCGMHRMPEGPSAPVRCAADALSAVHLAMSTPARPETIVLVLDADRRGHTIVVVDGTADDDAMLEVVDRLAMMLASHREGGALVVATIRPGRGCDHLDADRWLEASAIGDQLGIELVEWFVIVAGTTDVTAWCPRDLLAEPPRWTP
ncbi:MAG: hypothetical protein ACK5OX_02300 [Desertimonas sp.]